MDCVLKGVFLVAIGLILYFFYLGLSECEDTGGVYVQTYPGWTCIRR